MVMERQDANLEKMETQCLPEKESEEHREEDAKVAELGKELASSLELGSGGVDRWLTPEDLDHHDHRGNHHDHFQDHHV